MYLLCRRRKAAILHAFSSHHSFGGCLFPGRGHVLTHRHALVEVMGLHGGGGYVQLLDILGSDVDHLIDVLERTLDQEELGIGDQIPVRFLKIGADDGICDACLILERQEDETVIDG